MKFFRCRSNAPAPHSSQQERIRLNPSITSRRPSVLSCRFLVAALCIEASATRTPKKKKKKLPSQILPANLYSTSSPPSLPTPIHRSIFRNRKPADQHFFSRTPAPNCPAATCSGHEIFAFDSICWYNSREFARFDGGLARMKALYDSMVREMTPSEALYLLRVTGLEFFHKGLPHSLVWLLSGSLLLSTNFSVSLSPLFPARRHSGCSHLTAMFAQSDF